MLPPIRSEVPMLLMSLEELPLRVLLRTVTVATSNGFADTEL
jgi:hypothetical protein